MRSCALKSSQTHTGEESRRELLCVLHRGFYAHTPTLRSHKVSAQVRRSHTHGQGKSLTTRSPQLPWSIRRPAHRDIGQAISRDSYDRAPSTIRDCLLDNNVCEEREVKNARLCVDHPPRGVPVQRWAQPQDAVGGSDGTRPEGQQGLPEGREEPRPAA